MTKHPKKTSLSNMPFKRKYVQNDESVLPPDKIRRVEGKSSFLSLDLILHIMSFIGSWRDMLAFGLVDKRAAAALREMERKALLYETTGGREGCRRTWILRYFGRTRYQRWNPIKPEMIDVICPLIGDTGNRNTSALRKFAEADVEARGIGKRTGEPWRYIPEDEYAKSPALLSYFMDKQNYVPAGLDFAEACKTLEAYGDLELCVRFGRWVKLRWNSKVLPAYDPKKHTDNPVMALALYGDHTFCELLKLLVKISEDPRFVWNSFAHSVSIPHLAETDDLEKITNESYIRIPWSSIRLPKPIEGYTDRTQASLLRLTSDCSDGDLLATVVLNTYKKSDRFVFNHSCEALLLGLKRRGGRHDALFTIYRIEDILRTSRGVMCDEAAEYLIGYFPPKYQIPNDIARLWTHKVNPAFVVDKIDNMPAATRGQCARVFVSKFLRMVPRAIGLMRVVYDRLSVDIAEIEDLIG